MPNVKRNASRVGPDARLVQQMFADIAHRYDFLNHFLSLSVDQHWRRQAVRLIASRNPSPSDVCLDVCSGTGDLALELHRTLGLPVVGSDFCHPMLTRSAGKIEKAGFVSAIRLIEADALNLPFHNSSFSFVTIAFGLRNLERLDHGLRELGRVLKPGGSLVILEFSRPTIPVIRELFGLYFSYVLPRLGAVISGKKGPYQYLPSSVRHFPPQEELSALMRAAQFEEVGYRNLTGGIAALHWGRKGGDGDVRRQP